MLAAQQQDNQSLLIFRVGPVTCAAPVVNVESIINPPDKMTSMPGQAPFVSGVFLHRQETAAVVCVRFKFGLGKRTDKASGKIIMVRLGEKLTGFWVDEIVEVTVSGDLEWSEPPRLIPRAVFDKTLLYKDEMVLHSDFSRLFTMEDAGAFGAWVERKAAEEGATSAALEAVNEDQAEAPEQEDDTETKAAAETVEAVAEAPVQTEPEAVAEPEPVPEPVVEATDTNAESLQKDVPETASERHEEPAPVEPAAKTAEVHALGAAQVESDKASDDQDRTRHSSSALQNKAFTTVSFTTSSSSAGGSAARAMPEPIAEPDPPRSEAVEADEPDPEPMAVEPEPEFEAEPFVQAEPDPELAEEQLPEILVDAEVIPLHGTRREDDVTQAEEDSEATDYDESVFSAPKEAKPVRWILAASLLVGVGLAAVPWMDPKTPADAEPSKQIVDNGPIGQPAAPVLPEKQVPAQSQVEDVPQTETVTDVEDPEPVTEQPVVSSVAETRSSAADDASVVETVEPPMEPVVVQKRPETPAGPPLLGLHIVVDGDTLWRLSETYVNNPYRYPELARLSKIRNPDLIFPGDHVRYPKKPSTPAE